MRNGTPLAALEASRNDRCNVRGCYGPVVGTAAEAFLGLGRFEPSQDIVRAESPLLANFYADVTHSFSEVFIKGGAWKGKPCGEFDE